MKKTLFILAIALCGAGMLFAQPKGFVSGGLSLPSDEYTAGSIDASFGMPLAGVIEKGTKKLTIDLPFSHLIQKDLPDTIVMNDKDYDDSYFVFEPVKPENAGKHRGYFIQKDVKKFDVVATRTLTVIECEGTVIADGVVADYPSIYVNGLCWTKENLREAPLAAAYADKAFPYDNITANAEIYGLLYTWAAAVSNAEGTVAAVDGFVQGVCPEGWHIPTAAEMSSLREVSDLELNSTTLWQGTQASLNTNASGFTALPAGIFNDALDRFEGLGTQTDWWSDNGGNSSTTTVKVTEINYYCSNAEEKDMNVSNAVSVRCVKTNPYAEPTCHASQLVKPDEQYEDQPQPCE